MRISIRTNFTEKISLKPALIIGLGGTGGHILLKFLRIVEEVNKKHPEIKKYYEILYLDTNDAGESSQYDGTSIKPNITLSRDPREGIDYYWIDKRDKRYKQTQQQVTQFPGAGARRAFGRLALFNHLKDVKQRIFDTTNRLAKKAGSTDRFDFYICGSIAGGTGSGCFMDIAVILHKLISERAGVFQHIAQPDRRRIIAVLMGPEIIKQGNKLLQRANAYAALKELSYVLKKGYTFEYRGVFTYDFKPSQESLFNFIFLIDKGEHESIKFSDREDLAELAAHFIFWFMSTHQGNLVRANCEAIAVNIPGLHKGDNWCDSFGARTILFPVEEIIEYCKWQVFKDALDDILDIEEKDLEKVKNNLLEFHQNIEKQIRERSQNISEDFIKEEIEIKNKLEDIWNDVKNEIIGKNITNWSLIGEDGEIHRKVEELLEKFDIPEVTEAFCDMKLKLEREKDVIQNELNKQKNKAGNVLMEFKEREKNRITYWQELNLKMLIWLKKIFATVPDISAEEDKLKCGPTYMKKLKEEVIGEIKKYCEQKARIYLIEKIIEEIDKWLDKEVQEGIKKLLSQVNEEVNRNLSQLLNLKSVFISLYLIWGDDWKDKIKRYYDKKFSQFIRKDDIKNVIQNGQIRGIPYKDWAQKGITPSQVIEYVKGEIEKRIKEHDKDLSNVHFFDSEIFDYEPVYRNKDFGKFKKILGERVVALPLAGAASCQQELVYLINKLPQGSSFIEWEDRLNSSFEFNEGKYQNAVTLLTIKLGININDIYPDIKDKIKEQYNELKEKELIHTLRGFDAHINKLRKYNTEEDKERERYELWE